MPTVLRVGGHRFFFFSNEGQEPPHIHISTAENYVKFWLDPVELEASSGYNGVELRRLRDIILEHREQLLQAWNEFFSNAN